MNHRSTLTASFIVAAVLITSATPAHAQWGALQRTLFRDLNYGLSPNIISFPQNGPLFDFNNFTQRVEYDRVGDGYAYEFYRFFGPDSFGEPSFLDLGGLKLELGPNPALGQSQYTGVHGRMGFKTRLIPEVFFLAESGQRNFNQFSGVSNFNNEPISYTATLNTGIQDLEWSGNIQFDASGTINILGFYDFDARIVNVGSFTADGVALKDEQVTDFDTGPINLSGHIGMDLLASVFQANGSELAGAVPRIFSAAAGKERTADELVDAMRGGEKLTDEEVQFMIEQLFIQAFKNDPLGFIMNGPPSTLPGFDGLGLVLTPGSSDDENGNYVTDRSEVPEPGTLLLLGTLTAFGLQIRKRGGLMNLPFATH